MNLFTRDLNSDPVSGKLYEKISGIAIGVQAVTVQYVRTLVLDNGSELTLGTFTVTRQIDDVTDDILTLLGGLATLAEKWRGEDVEARAAEAARMAEVQANRAALAAKLSASSEGAES